MLIKTLTVGRGHLIFPESVAYFRQCGSDALFEQGETEQAALAKRLTNKPEKKVFDDGGGAQVMSASPS